MKHIEYRHRTPWWKKGRIARYNDASLVWRTDAYGHDAADLSCDRCGSVIATLVPPVSAAGVMSRYDLHLKDECDK